MTFSRLLRLVLAGLVSVAFLAGCGDDDTAESDTDDTTSEEDTDESPDDTGDDAEMDGEDDGSDGSTDGDAASDVTEPVTDAYVTFFTNFAGDLALLEDGESFDPAVIAAMQDNAESTGEITVDVKAVSALDDADCDAAGVIAPCAEVTFDLVVNGTAAVPDQTGYAVEQDGAWKVAKTTFCALASLSGGTPEGC